MPIVRLATCEAGGLSAWSPWPRAGTGGSSPLTTTSARSCRLLQTRGQRNRRRATLGDNVRPSAAAGSAQKRTFPNYRFVTKFNAVSDVGASVLLPLIPQYPEFTGSVLYGRGVGRYAPR